MYIYFIHCNYIQLHFLIALQLYKLYMFRIIVTFFSIKFTNYAFAAINLGSLNYWKRLLYHQRLCFCFSKFHCYRAYLTATVADKRIPRRATNNDFSSVLSHTLTPIICRQVRLG